MVQQYNEYSHKMTNDAQADGRVNRSPFRCDFIPISKNQRLP